MFIYVKRPPDSLLLLDNLQPGAHHHIYKDHCAKFTTSRSGFNSFLWVRSSPLGFNPTIVVVDMNPWSAWWRFDSDWQWDRFLGFSFFMQKVIIVIVVTEEWLWRLHKAIIIKFLGWLRFIKNVFLDVVSYMIICLALFSRCSYRVCRVIGTPFTHCLLPRG